MRHIDDEKTSRVGWRLLAIPGLAGVLVLIVAVAVWSAWDTPFEGLSADAVSSDRDVERGAEPPLEGISEGSARASTTEVPRQPVATAVATEASVVAAGEHVGRLVVLDVDGRELPHEKGELVLRPEEGAEKLVPFHDGLFSLEGFPEGRIRIERATAFSGDGDRPVAFEEVWFEFGFDDPTLLIGHYLRDCTLRVLDARTGVMLDDVGVLFKLPEHAGPEQSHPGPHGESSFYVLGAASPVRLPRMRGIQPYWVTARGYGWRFVQVDHETGGERDVLLEPAGRLDVQVLGEIETYLGGDQGVDIYIRVYSHATGKVATSSSLNSPRKQGFSAQGFSGLAEGTYDVKVEVGPADDHPIVLGEAQVEIIANSTSTARVDLTGDRIPPAVRVRGEIVLPDEYRDLDVSLRIQPVDGPVLRRRDVKLIKRGDMSTLEAVRGWDANYLTSGQYLFVVVPVQYGVLVDVPHSPVDNLRIVVPDLFPITLRAIDAETRQPIPGATIRWSRELPAEAGADAWVEIGLKPGQESAIAQLPAGRFSFAASSPTHGERSMAAYAGTGESQFTLELPPHIPLEIVLVYGDTVIPWAQGMTCSFQRLGSENSHPCESLGDGKLRACFERPGLYEITLSQLEGFRDPDPVRISVDQGNLSPVVVRLAR